MKSLELFRDSLDLTPWQLFELLAEATPIDPEHRQRMIHAIAQVNPNLTLNQHPRIQQVLGSSSGATFFQCYSAVAEVLGNAARPSGPRASNNSARPNAPLPATPVSDTQATPATPSAPPAPLLTDATRAYCKRYGLCRRCRKHGHKAINCKSADAYPLPLSAQDCTDLGLCLRCGKQGHYAHGCREPPPSFRASGATPEPSSHRFRSYSPPFGASSGSKPKSSVDSSRDPRLRMKLNGGGELGRNNNYPSRRQSLSPSGLVPSPAPRGRSSSPVHGADHRMTSRRSASPSTTGLYIRGRAAARDHDGRRVSLYDRMRDERHNSDESN